MCFYEKGFTLVELIGVVVILGLISLIAIPTVTSSLKNIKHHYMMMQLLI